MTKQEALKILDQAGSQFRGTRQDHASIIEAIRTLDDTGTVPPPPPSKPKKPRTKRS